MAGNTFREWLAARVGEGPGCVSRRELARRLAAAGFSDAESHRRSIRRFLDGSIVPTNRTREAIGLVLEDGSWPSVEDDEDEDVAAALKKLARSHAEQGRKLRAALRAVKA